MPLSARNNRCHSVQKYNEGVIASKILHTPLRDLCRNKQQNARRTKAVHQQLLHDISQSLPSGLLTTAVPRVLANSVDGGRQSQQMRLHRRVAYFARLRRPSPTIVAFGKNTLFAAHLQQSGITARVSGR